VSPDEPKWQNSEIAVLQRYGQDKIVHFSVPNLPEKYLCGSQKT